MKLHLLISATVIAVMPCHAQLSGVVDLGGGSPKSEAATEANIKEITVTGTGETLEAAEKEALASAIRQAVGAYMDSKTIVENEEVIQDRILSVSNAFVEKYEVVVQPKKSSDGLIEITILAKVKTNQVVQALKENNLISGEVAGQNLWAEASTKVMNAQDAVAMLQAKFPEIIKSCLTITPLDKDLNPAMTKDASGNLVPNTAPAVFNQNSESGKATLCWAFEIGLDKKYYRESFLPLVNKCLESITESKSQKEKKKLITTEEELSRSYMNNLDNPLRYGFNKDVKVKNAKPEGNIPFPSLIISYSRNYDMCEYFYYPNAKNYLVMEFPKEEVQGSMPTTRNACSLTLELQDENGEVVAFQKKQFCWQPFRDLLFQKNVVGFIGPNADSANEIEPKFKFIHRPIVFVKITVPISELKDIKNAIASLEVNEPTFSIRAIER